MSDLTKDRVWDQIETLRAKYAQEILQDQAVIVAARARIATNRQLADELPVLKTRRKKPTGAVTVEGMTAVLTALNESLKADEGTGELQTLPGLSMDEFSGEKLNAKLEALATGELPGALEMFPAGVIRDDV